MRPFSIVLLAILGLCCVNALQIAPIFVLDLAKPPANRWDGAVKLVLQHHSWNDSFAPLIDHYNKSLLQHLSEQDKLTLFGSLPLIPNLVDELKGIEAQFAAVGHPEVDIWFLMTWVWFHELDHANDLVSPRRQPAACTGILALPSDASADVIHGRNLDQTVFAGRNLTLDIRVVQNASESSEILFQAVDFYWMSTGFVTATMKGAVTLEENWRYESNLTLGYIMSLVQEGAVPQTRMFRNLLQSLASKETQKSRSALLHTNLRTQSTLGNFSIDPFETAVQFLTTASFASPFYVIMSGTKRRGAVISVAIDQSYTVVSKLGEKQPSSWYMVQTNYDRWLPDPKSDPRRTFAEGVLKDLGQEEAATRLGVWQALSVYPVHNAHTYYTVLMTVGNYSKHGFIREPMLPKGWVNRTGYHN